jgi:hypothetical protein
LPENDERNARILDQVRKQNPSKTTTQI